MLPLPRSPLYGHAALASERWLGGLAEAGTLRKAMMDDVWQPFLMVLRKGVKNDLIFAFFDFFHRLARRARERSARA